jgi:site-specific recombinase XerD
MPKATPLQTHDVSALEYGESFINTILSSPKTAETYRHGLGRLATFIADTKYAKRITGEDAPPPPAIYRIDALRDDLLLKFYEWLVLQKYSPATVDNSIAAVKRFLIWLDANDRLATDFQVGKAVNRLSAARGARRTSKAGREPDPGVPRIVTYFDEQTLPAADTAKNKLERLKLLRARAIVHTLYASAGRVSEVASLTREMVLDGRVSEVRITGKGDKDRMLLLTKDAQRAIAAYCKERDDDHPGLFISHGRGAGKSLRRGTLWAVVKQAANALGLYKGTSPHAFRHYRAQQLLHEGMDLDVLQAYLGHSDISTTRRIYAPHTAIGKVRDQLETFGRSASEAARDKAEDGD